MTEILRHVCGLNLCRAGLATLLCLSAVGHGSQSTESNGHEAAKLIDQLDDADPQIRRMARCGLTVFDGAALPAAEAALSAMIFRQSHTHAWKQR